MSDIRRALGAAGEAVQLAIANGGAAVLGVLYLLLTARMVGPTRFADLSVCLSLTYLGLLFLVPLNLTLIRFSSAYRATDDATRIRPLLRKATRMYAPWVGLGVGAAILLAKPIARALHIETTALVPWAAVFVALGLIVGALRAVVLGVHEHGTYARSLLVETGVRAGGGLLLVAAYRTAGAGLAGFLIGALAAVALLLPRTLRLLPASDAHWADAPDVSRFMTLALLFAAIVSGLQNVDMLAAKMRLSASDAGDYAVALAVARGFLILAAPFSAVSLSRVSPEGVSGSLVSRVLRAPITAYVVLCAPVLAAIAFAPARSLQLLFGRSTPTQQQLVPILALGFLVGGAFQILAQPQIRAGRFSFLIPVSLVLGAELALLGFVPPSAVGFAWTVLLAHAAGVGSVILAPALLRRLRRFDGSAKYWESRYARGGTSGVGSVGKFAQFKAEILNDFVARNSVESIIELGCGDGSQLALARYPRYLGFDVSLEAIRLCRDRFKGDPTKDFRPLAEYCGESADLALSLDVIFHLVEDDVFDDYMRRLFQVSTRWVIVYSSDSDFNSRNEAPHVRHREFTRWVREHRPEWVLRERIPNRFAFTGDFRLGSFSDFFIFERSLEYGCAGSTG